MLDDLFVPDPPAGDSSNQIANTRFIGTAIGFATIAGPSLLGNSTAATAMASGISLSAYLDTAAGSTNGALLARNATTWTALPPAWSTYTPSLTSGLGALTSTGVGTGRFTQVGKTVFCSINVSITTNGTGSSFLIVGLPATSQGVLVLAGREDQVNGKMLYAVSSAARITAIVQYYDNTYPGVNGGRYMFGGSYEVP